MDISFHKKDNKLQNNAFILSFCTIIWKRIFACLFLYSKYKCIPVNTENLLKCLKYNLLAETGFVEKMKPYLIKALTNGFLMPKECDNNVYVKRAIFLFGDAYMICKFSSNKEENDFVQNYISKIFSEEELDVLENDLEAKDLLFDVRDSDIKADDKDELDSQKLKFCDLIDTWDVDLSLIYRDDPYFNLLKISLLSFMNRS